MKAAKSAGCRLQCLRPVPGSAVPKTKNRRDGAPDGVAVASRLRRFGDDAADTESQGAPPGAPSPLMVRGGNRRSKPGAFARGNEQAWAEFRSPDDVALATTKALRWERRARARAVDNQGVATGCLKRASEFGARCVSASGVMRGLDPRIHQPGQDSFQETRLFPGKRMAGSSMRRRASHFCPAMTNEKMFLPPLVQHAFAAGTVERKRWKSPALPPQDQAMVLR